jgi:hypothetical protein
LLYLFFIFPPQATDNLTAALGHFLDKFESKIPHSDVDNLWTLWLEHLPIKEDEDEVRGDEKLKKFEI